MSFCTAINCMDGRVQLPVIRYLQDRFNALYVDTITEPGPNLVLGKQTDEFLLSSILKRINISVQKHFSVGIALVGHYDCAGNPAAREEQEQHLISGIQFLSQQYLNIPIIGIWVDESLQVHEIENNNRYVQGKV
ncbi:MAG: carbonic anhydrase [Thermodesulfobacteriota bacterium]